MNNRDTDRLRLSKRDYDEEDVQQAMLNSPDTAFGEEILIIGKEVQVGSHDMNSGQDERIDILGIDTDLNACVVELKNKKLTRGHVKQVIKHAPYVDEFSNDRFEKEFGGTSEEFREWVSDVSGEDLSLNTEQRLLLVGPSAQRRTVRMIDWLQSQGVGLELIIFNDDGIKEDPVLSMEKKPVEVENWPKDVAKWNESVEKAKEYHRRDQASAKTVEPLNKFINTIETQTDLKSPFWQQKNSFHSKIKRFELRYDHISKRLERGSCINQGIISMRVQ